MLEPIDAEDCGPCLELLDENWGMMEFPYSDTEILSPPYMFAKYLPTPQSQYTEILGNDNMSTLRVYANYT